MKGEREMHESTEGLPLRALYTLGELAKVASVERRKLMRVLDKAGVERLRVGRFWVFPLSELERKARPLWESIKAAEVLRHVMDGQ